MTLRKELLLIRNDKAISIVVHKEIGVIYSSILHIGDVFVYSLPAAIVTTGMENVALGTSTNGLEPRY